MGEPKSFFIILQWIWDLLEIKGDIMAFMGTIPSRPKY